MEIVGDGRPILPAQIDVVAVWAIAVNYKYFYTCPFALYCRSRFLLYSVTLIMDPAFLIWPPASSFSTSSFDLTILMFICLSTYFSEHNFFLSASLCDATLNYACTLSTSAQYFFCCFVAAHTLTNPANATAAGQELLTRGRAPAKLFLPTVSSGLVTVPLQLGLHCAFRVGRLFQSWFRTSILSVTSIPRSRRP